MDELVSTMQDYPLTLSALLRHGRDVHPDSQVITGTDGVITDQISVETLGNRAAALARGLRQLGVAIGERVGTLCWNHRAHLEAYWAVPAMGAVLHMINARLSDEQLEYVINDAGDTVLLVDPDLLPRLEPLLRRLPAVRAVVTLGDQAEPATNPLRLTYTELVDSDESDYPWPDLDERAPSGVSYTTGTIGLPKGVVYSHRSVWLHALTICSGAAMALSERDRILQLTPLYHVNGWGLPHAAMLTGADLVLPGRAMSAGAVSHLIAATRPSIAVSIPLIWSQLAEYARDHVVDLSSLRDVFCAGSSVPSSLIEHFDIAHGVRLTQGWGMTEVSPWGGLAQAATHHHDDAAAPWRQWSGRLLPGLEMRIIGDDDQPTPRDGHTVGEIELRGPWVTGCYLGGGPSGGFSEDGWLRTGDVGTLDRHGYFRITDRSKDVIKSGGEWIASVTLQDILVAHPDVLAAAVIGMPDPRWDERPLAVLVLRDGVTAVPDDLAEFVAARAPRWWVPDRWSVVGELPRTSVGKLDKKALRASVSAGDLAISTLPVAPAAR